MSSEPLQPKARPTTRPATSNEAGASATALNSASILRRRQPGSPFGAASKVLGAVTSNLGKNITDIITRQSSASPRGRQPQAPTTAVTVGTTQAFSLVLTHVIAPLWAVSAKTIGVQPAPVDYNAAQVRDLAAAMDQVGFDPAQHAQALHTSLTLATAYITLLIAKLLMIESVDAPRATFAEIAEQTAKEVHLQGEYEEHFNDETVAHDQPRRRLVEVGGTWKPRGAAEVSFHVHDLRRRLLRAAMQASVCYRYFYTDDVLHSYIDTLSNQLFLLNYSESFAALVAGMKGPNYVAKYCAHFAVPRGDLVVHECLTRGSELESLVLHEVSSLAFLALENLVHRNDTSEVVLVALTRAVGITPPAGLATLFTLTIRFMHRMYMADIGLLQHLFAAVRAHAVAPNPTGALAFELMSAIQQSIASVNTLQLRLCQSSFVAGVGLRSFRRMPAQLLGTPLAARSSVLARVFLTPVDQQRGINPLLPTVLDQSLDPATGAPLDAPLDDAVLYLANLVSNVFQAVRELGHGRPGLQATESIDLAQLFSLPPHVLAQLLPTVVQFFQSAPETNRLGDPATCDHSTFLKIVDLFVSIMDTNKATRGQRRFRLETPRTPFAPLHVSIPPESDDMMDAVKHTIDRHWRYCDQRVMDKEIAGLHPKKELSLSHFIESYINVVVAGGGGFIRRLVSGLLQMRNAFPGAVPQLRLFLLPLGHESALASWVARNDPLYRQLVFGPFAALAQKVNDAPSFDFLNAGPCPMTFESLELRRAINTYLTDGTIANEVIVYQAECTTADGSVTYIPWLSSIEVGLHVNLAANGEGATNATFGNGSAAASFCYDPSAGMMGGGGVSSPTGRRGGRSAGSTIGSFVAISNASLLGNSVSSSWVGTTSGLSFAGGPGAPAAAVAAQAAAAAASGGGGGGTGGGVGGGGGMATTSTGVPVAHAGNPSLAAMGGYDGARHIVVGSTTESAGRTLVRLHGTRGLQLSSKRHPSEARELRHVASGTDVLDWISTTYHLFETGATGKVAQSLLDAGVILCVAMPAGKDPIKFHTTGLYGVQRREEVDAQPLWAAGPRNRVNEIATGILASLSNDYNPPLAQMHNPMKVSFTPGQTDLTYVDLIDGNATVRDVTSLRLRSVSSGGDLGLVASPLHPTLSLCINEVEKRRPTRPRDLVDRCEHYQLQFGNDYNTIDTGCVLTMETRCADDAGGMFALVDGDVFGPFMAIRVRPVVGQPSTAAGPAATAAAGGATASNLARAGSGFTPSSPMLKQASSLRDAFASVRRNPTGSFAPPQLPAVTVSVMSMMSLGE